MAEMQIRGGQILAGSITNTQISASAAIALSKLAEAVIQADGGQAFTADQSMGSFKLTNLADGTATTDAVNKGQLDAVAAGLDYKEAVRVATTAVLSGTMIADNGTPATGQRAYSLAGNTITWFATEGPTAIDGVTLANGNRILVKNETATSGPSATEGRQYNGIYVRTSLDVWTRSTDMDGTPTNEISTGNAVFVVSGTANANTGWLLSTTDAADPDAINADTETKNFVQYNAASSYTASNGITLSGNDFQLNLTGLSATAIATGDELVFADVSDSNNEKKITAANFFIDLDVPNGITANGLITRTAADTYASRTITGTASRVSVTNGDGVSGNPTIDIDASYVGQSSITTLGTITTGVWNGTAVTVPYGGTGATTFTANALLYGNTTSAIQATTNLRIDNANNEIQSADQTAGTTNSANISFASGSVSGATSDSGSVTVATGASTTSGNSASLFLMTGAATSGDSGDIAIRTGAASGTNGSILFQIDGATTEATIDGAGIDLATGNDYQINNVSVLSATTLGSSVVTSSLTAVSTLTTGTWNATVIGTLYGGTGLAITPTAIADGDLLIGSNSGDAFVRTTLTAGTGISITNGAGSITIALTEGGMVSESDFVTDDFTGDNSTTVFNLSGTAAAATNSLIHAYINGVRQKFTTHFTATTTAVTFTSAPATGDLIQVSYITA